MLVCSIALAVTDLEWVIRLIGKNLFGDSLASIAWGLGVSVSDREYTHIFSLDTACDKNLKQLIKAFPY